MKNKIQAHGDISRRSLYTELHRSRTHFPNTRSVPTSGAAQLHLPLPHTVAPTAPSGAPRPRAAPRAARAAQSRAPGAAPTGGSEPSRAEGVLPRSKTKPSEQKRLSSLFFFLFTFSSSPPPSFFFSFFFSSSFFLFPPFFFIFPLFLFFLLFFHMFFFFFYYFYFSFLFYLFFFPRFLRKVGKSLLFPHPKPFPRSHPRVPVPAGGGPTRVRPLSVPRGAASPTPPAPSAARQRAGVFPGVAERSRQRHREGHTLPPSPPSPRGRGSRFAGRGPLSPPVPPH